MEEENIEKAVLAYLKKKGYHQAELALKEEQTKSSLPPVKTDPEIAKQILHHRSDDVPTRYKEGYNKLQLWVHSSLDLYKSELLWILYPIFVHSFMDLVSKGFSQEAKEFFQMFREDHEALHLRDLQKLQGLLSPQHVQEMELARSLRENKVNIKMCQYSFELLLQYLHNTESTLMLGIVNEHVNFQVVPGQLAAGSEKEDVISVGEKSLEAFNQINQKEIRWGVLEDSLEERLGKELAAEAEKVDGEGKEADGEEVKKRAAEIGKAGGGKKIKKDKAAGTVGKGLRTETTLSTTPRVKSQLVMPSVSEEKERLVLEDLRCRARLASTALPSVSFYTFINTHHSLNCASISLDGSLVVGGFADSSLKVWDMAKIGERLVDNENGNVDGGATEGIEDGKSTHSDLASVDSPRTRYKLLHGHAGPIYAANFSPDGDYILSASNDCTVRLWSLQMNANLVCYKGHNHPVWDVQFSPVGHYFASSSHDRTARVWSMDRIQPLRIMAGHLSDVDCVQWHVNCNYIATGSIDKTVRLWDVQTGECMRVFTGHRGTITSLAMSPDGRHMASGDEDGSIMMWDLGSGRCVTPLMGHTSSVWTLDFSCEGSLLCSGSADCTVRIWDVNASSKASRSEEKQQGARRLRLLKTLPTKSSPVYSLRFSRRNHLLAAGPFSPSIEMPPRRSLSK